MFTEKCAKITSLSHLIIIHIIYRCVQRIDDNQITPKYVVYKSTLVLVCVIFQKLYLNIKYSSQSR